MEKDSIQLTVKSHPQSLKQVRKLIMDVATQLDVDKGLTGNLILAVDEVCSNIIRHGYKNDADQEICLSISTSKNQLVIQIEDRGACFDLTQAEPRDPADIKPGGLGVYIIKQVMDHVECSRTEAGLNRTLLIKKLS